MAKRRGLTRREKDMRIKKIAKILFIGFVSAVVLATVIGVAGVKIAEYRKEQAVLDRIRNNDIEKKLAELYKEDPWEGEQALDSEKIVLSKDLQLYYTALRSLEMDAAYAENTEGYQFDSSAGNVFCLDIANIPENVLPSVIKMYEDYSESKGMIFAYSTMEQLKNQGKINENYRNAYTEGVLVRPGAPKETVEGMYSVSIEVYYNYMNLRIPEVVLISEQAFEEFKEYYFEDYKVIRKEQDLTLYRRTASNGYQDDRLLLRFDGWYAYVEQGLTA